MHERRKWPRFTITGLSALLLDPGPEADRALDVCANGTVLGDDGRAALELRILNVSAAGAWLQAPAAPAVGARIELQLVAPNHPPVPIVGTVVRHHGQAGMFAVHFQSSGTEMEDAIHAFLLAQLTRFCGAEQTAV